MEIIRMNRILNPIEQINSTFLYSKKILLNNLLKRNPPNPQIMSNESNNRIHHPINPNTYSNIIRRLYKHMNQNECSKVKRILVVL